MRLIHAAILATAALLLAPIASAQGLGSVAAREKEKRDAAPVQPTKVYTDNDLGSSVSVPVPATEAIAAEGEAAAQTEGSAAEGEPGGEAEKTEEDQRAEAEKAWRTQLEKTRQEIQLRQNLVDQIQQDLNDPASGYFSAGRTRKLASLDEQKAKIAELQARVSALEEEGRRNRYR